MHCVIFGNVVPEAENFSISIEENGFQLDWSSFEPPVAVNSYVLMRCLDEDGDSDNDIIFSDNFSIFFIYEHKKALGVGYTNKIHIAIGYLPNKENNYALSIDGSEGLVSKFKIKKNIDDFNIDLNFHEDFSNFGNNRGVAITLNKLF